MHQYVSFFNYFGGLTTLVPKSPPAFFPVPAFTAGSVHPTLRMSLSDFVQQTSKEIKLSYPGVAFSHLFKWIPGSLSCSLIMQGCGVLFFF